jgi:hypothetical protein
MAYNCPADLVGKTAKAKTWKLLFIPMLLFLQ